MNLRDFRIGWRLLAKEPAYSAVVILGLAVGIAACVLLLGFVRHSFSYDRDVPHRERVFQLQTHWNVAPLDDGWSGFSPLPPRDAALASGEPLLATAVIERGVDARAGTRLQSLHLDLVDPDFAKIFAPRVLAGDLHAALTRPDALALTHEAAVKLFGDADPIGKTLTVDRLTYRVAAVVADPPAATTLPYDALGGTGNAILTQEFRREVAENWGFSPGGVYIALLPGARPERVLDAMQRGLAASSLVRRNYAEQVSALQGRNLIDYRLQPIAENYLGDVKDPLGEHGNRQAVLGLGAVAVLILLLAATNYVNLATVRTLARRREIAVRKVLGASGHAVARQFLAESVLVCLIATGLGLLLAWLLLPVFADLVQRKLEGMLDAPVVAVVLALGVLLGLATGVWPGLSALRVLPTAALAGRGGAETARGLWARRLLTALQFATAMGLTATTLAVAWQARHAASLDLGFDTSRLMMFATSGTMREPRMRALRDEIARLPDVEGVAVSHLPFSVGNNIVTLRRPGAPAVDLSVYWINPDFFRVYGLTALAGRLFDPALDKPDEPDRVVVDAAAARSLGFSDPNQAVGQVVTDPGDDKPIRIVGVASDMRHRSARDVQQPSVYYLRERIGGFTVRAKPGVDPDTVRHAVAAILARQFPNEIIEVTPMRRLVSRLFYDDDLRLAKLLAAASVIAMAIAAFGIYVLAAYGVRRREREIVLRKLYGAGAGAIGALVAREFFALLGAGALLGLPLAWIAIERYLGGFSERAPIGAWTLLAALVVAGAVALASTLRHALAAVRIRPALALRE